jgi:hypothetical protein
LQRHEYCSTLSDRWYKERSSEVAPW